MKEVNFKIKARVVSILLGCILGIIFDAPLAKAEVKAEKLYWFIPCGMRAEPDLFNIYKWAEEGKLPNIKKMMDNGSYGFSIPVFPGHTPVNFATLLTGVYPKTHGVADGPMHIEGFPLNIVSCPGFSSTAKKVPPIWTTLEENDKLVCLLSVPGSTPPELDKGLTIRGRWGGWGADFHALIFESKLDNQQRKKQGKAARLFFFGPELTKYIDSEKPQGWKNPPKTYSEPFEIKMKGYGRTIYGYISDSTDNNRIDFDTVTFSFDRQTNIAALKKGQWSNWNKIILKWNNLDVESDVIFHVIKLDEDGFFRIRCFYNNLNKFIMKPADTYKSIRNNTGPMIDFVDNWPAQLIYYAEDKNTFLQEMKMSFNWHIQALDYLLKTYRPDVLINNIYNPNQMLESRWWLGYLDPRSERYHKVNPQEREKLWGEVLGMYQKLDEMLGVLLKNADSNTLIVLSSDHGTVPLNKKVRVNNLLAKEGLLKFTVNKITGEPVIDWDNSTAVYLQMDNVFINPNGLGGKWKRASGEEYEKLRDRVRQLLLNLRDGGSKRPVLAAVNWEDVDKYLELPKDRVGDIVIANEAGYGWTEEITKDLEIFSVPLGAGYKQAIVSETNLGMWTPFMVMGPGVKKGYRIIRPISQVDQYPTIMKLLGVKLPYSPEGKVLKEIFTK